MTLQAYQRSFHLRSRKKSTKRYSPDDYIYKKKGPAEDEDDDDQESDDAEEHVSEDEDSEEHVSEDEDSEDDVAEEEPMKKLPVRSRRKNADPAPTEPLRRLRKRK